MPYRYNAITGEFDLVMDGGALGAVTQIDTDSGSVVPAGGIVNLLGDATQGLSTSGAGDTATLTIADATESQKGVVELATDAEAIAGTANTNLAIIPSSLTAKLGVQTQYGIAIGNTTAGALNWTGAGTDGQIPIAATGADPSFASLTSSGGTITFTPGPNTLNLEAGATTPTTFQTDSGNAVPSGNIIKVFGGTNINSSGAGNTVTVNLDADITVDSMATSDASDGLTISSNGIVADGTNADIDIDLTPKGEGRVATSLLAVNYATTGNGITIAGTSFSSDVIAGDEGVANVIEFTGLSRNNIAADGGLFVAARARDSAGNPAIVQSGDDLLRFVSVGFDGTDYAISTEIRSEVDGTPGAGDMPGRLVFLTSPDGTETPVEAMRIDSSQAVTLANALTVPNGGTGATTLTDHGVLVGSGTGAVSVTAVGTSGQILTSNGAGSDPTFQDTSAFTSVVVQSFTSGGTYTPTSGMKYCTIECVGGGGGGGATTTTAAGNITTAGGGGGGGYARITVTAATIGASQSVTVGSGGAGGVAPAGTGTAGGSTSVGSICVAGGGSGGLGGGTATTATLVTRGGTGGVGSSGTILSKGQSGGFGIAYATFPSFGGAGGNSFFGGGADVPGSAGASSQNNGSAYGGGGSGCATGGGGNTQGNGGNGSAGLVVVTEYI